MKKVKTSVYLFPAALAVVFMSSILIIVSPIGRKTLVPIPTPIVTPAVTPTPIPWQTYKSNSDNYEISYPPSWIANVETYGVVNLVNKQYGIIRIDSTNESGVILPVNTWIKNQNANILKGSKNNPDVSILNIVSNDHVLKINQAVTVINEGDSLTVAKMYIFVFNKKIMVINAQYPVFDKEVGIEINQILSTFKFTDSKPVVISSPDLSKPVTSPFLISGKINRSWVFEGSFPIELFDSQNHSLFAGVGSAPKWSEGTDQFVVFTAKLNFVTTDTSGFLEIRKDNPSGLPQNDQSIRFPIIF